MDRRSIPASGRHGEGESAGALDFALAADQAALETIEAQLAVQLGRSDRVREACSVLEAALFASREADATVAELRAALVERLSLALLERRGDAAAALLERLETWIWALEAPIPALLRLLRLRDRKLLRQLLASVGERAARDELSCDAELLERLGALVEARPDDGELLALAAGLVGVDDEQRRARARGLILTGAPLGRCLAARILDATAATPQIDPWIAREVLGGQAAPFFEPYLEYTRASHRDLVDLVPRCGEAPPALVSLRRAEALLGHSELAQLIGELGWGRLGRGVEIERVELCSVGGGYPLSLRPEEVPLLEGIGEVERLGERTLVIAHGVAAAESGADEAQQQLVARFRRYNIHHAEALAEIMEVAPLTPAKVRRIVELIGLIVDDYLVLFPQEEEGIAELPACWQRLQDETEAALSAADPEAPLDQETTRLVQMFEDPTGVHDCTTLHGLKRYLHQAGLRHAFSRFRSGQAANCTVDLAVLAPRQAPRIVQRLRYLDFEPGDHASESAGLPLPVSMVARALGRQLLAGQRTLPHVEMLVYGNEVQVYVSFRNHPAFLRVDLSPPLRGGMLDLEYYGVSQYELDQHPDLSLGAIQQLFTRLGFHVEEERLRLHVRFDKEAAFDFGDILDKADGLFHLLPHLMDIDWVVGSLDYSPLARSNVVDAWADFWLHHGVLPIDELLSEDRRRIRLAERPAVSSDEQPCWDGRGRYEHRYADPPPDFWARLRASLEARGLAGLARWDALRGQGAGQLPLERAVLRPLREALARGELTLENGELTRVSAERFVREHPAERLARLLCKGREEGAEALLEAARLAALVRSVERQLCFVQAGSINGYEVLGATLALRGHRVGVYVLRDAEAISSLALAVDEGVLYRTGQPDGSWCDGPSLSAEELLVRLRQDNYLSSGVLAFPGAAPVELSELPSRLEVPAGRRGWEPTAEDRLVPAAVASPGRAAGFARLGRGRDLRDIEGQVLVLGELGPEDAPALRAASAIVTTSGGILSHAGLTALELGRPALIVPGELDDGEAEFSALRYRRAIFEEDERAVGPYAVRRRRALEEREETIEEGDLLVVDAEAETLEVLGRDSDTLAVHGALGLLKAVTEEEEGPEASSAEVDPWRRMERRGKVLRAYHQLEKLFGRLESAALARYAVWELLTSKPAGGEAGRRARGRVLTVLFANPKVGALARGALTERYRTLVERREALAQRALEGIREARNVFEIAHLLSRLERGERLAEDVGKLLAGIFGVPFHSPLAPVDIGAVARERFEVLFADRQESLEGGAARAPALVSHVLASVDRIQPFVPHVVRGLSQAHAARQALAAHQKRTLAALRGRRVMRSSGGGLELRSLVGGKAAHLGEVERALTHGRVPPWFVVSDAALRELLAQPVRSNGSEGALGQKLREVLDRNTPMAHKAARCEVLWRAVELPEALVAELREAFDAIAPADSEGQRPFVAVRSSAIEEDREESAWAGAFDTYLYVRGFSQVLEQLRRAFASFWGERALACRQAADPAAGMPDPAGGGVIIQRMVEARAAGVLYTAGAAAGEPREMVINVGLGLGEGVVSGRVEVDLVTVVKASAEGTLRFAYRVGDKKEQVVYDAARGDGTCLAPTLYHQRLRPALEYADLRELVAAALGLERAFCQPLDIEFAFEGSTLAILQLRPVPIFHAAYRELLARRGELEEEQR